MGDDSVPLRELLNKSGIPFQLAIETLIRGHETKTGVRVIGPEVPWAKGFIDIVASTSDRMFFGIECKKVDDKVWIVGMAHGKQKLAVGSNGLMEERGCTKVSPVYSARSGIWLSRPLRVSIASCPKGLLLHHWKLSATKFSQVAMTSWITRRIYIGTMISMIPVIVTNAKLYSCTFNPQKVIHRSGELDTNDGQFNCVDMVRFRKSLSNQGNGSFSVDR